MFTLQTLGSVDLKSAAGHSVQSVLAQPRRTALLLYLATAAPRGFHRRDTLLALLWPESDTEHGRAALSQALYFLRRSLSDSFLVSRGNGEVAVDPAQLRCDMVLFEEALRAGRREEALTLYRGDFLEGFHISEAPEFEQWMDRERSRLRARAVEATRRLAEEAERRDDVREALQWVRHGRTLAPLEEASLRRLLTLLARAGERGEAVREYEAFAEQLRTELGLEPSIDTRGLIEELRSPTRPRPPLSGPPQWGVQTPEPRRTEEAQEEPVPAASTGGVHVGAPLWRGSPPHPAQILRHRIAWVAAGALVVSLLAVMLSISPRAERAVLEENRVLVASFDNRTGDASLDVLGDMAADWITQGLQETELVQVIDPTSALIASRAVASDSALPAGMERVAALAERSGAGVVVTGAIYRQDDSLHFRTQVINAREKRLLRTIEGVAAPIGGAIGAVEHLRTRVAGTLASILDRRVASLSTPQDRAPTLEAYREYILGLEPFQRQRYKEAIPHFEAAARLDTTFTLPLFWAAFAHGNSGDRAERDSIVREIALRRDRLSPLDQHGLDYFLASSRGDLAGSLEAVRRAARLSPGSNWAYIAGDQALAQNRPREALQHLQQIDPERGWARGWKAYWHTLADAYHALGQHEAELEQAQRARRIDPAGAMLRLLEIRTLIALDRSAEAEALTEEMLRLADVYPAGELLFVVGLELRAHGHEDEAREVFGRVVEWARSPAAEGWVRAQPAFRHTAARRSVRSRLGEALYAMGRWEAARAQFEALRSEDPDDVSAWGWLGRVAARRGDRAEAERIVQHLQRRLHASLAVGRRPGGIRGDNHSAAIMALLGERERAVAYLRASMSQNRGPSLYRIRHDGDFDGLRDYAPFQVLVHPRG
jgi:DNA-binding SARP family transcriptional activator/TolB-like protein